MKVSREVVKETMKYHDWLVGLLRVNLPLPWSIDTLFMFFVVDLTSHAIKWAPSDVLSPTATNPANTAPQAPIASTLTHGFQAQPAAAAPVGQPTVGLPPKSHEQSRQNSHGATPNAPLSPYPGPPPPYAAPPSHPSTTTAPLPPCNAPPILVDPKFLEERERNALA